MKPKRIILIRHGESQANIDRYLYCKVPDYTIELSEKGIKDAEAVGKELKALVGEESLYFYVSPFWRARSTFENIAKFFPREQFIYSDEPRLREQEWGYHSLFDFDQICAVRKEYGTFFYRIPGGESGCDVYDRVNDLLGSMFRYFREDDYPDNCVLITHGLTIRLFIMRYYHLTVEDFEKMRSPHNCEMIILEKHDDDKFYVQTNLIDESKVLKYERPIKL